MGTNICVTKFHSVELQKKGKNLKTNKILRQITLLFEFDRCNESFLFFYTSKRISKVEQQLRKSSETYFHNFF